jgi:hypothetical protein
MFIKFIALHMFFPGIPPPHSPSPPNLRMPELLQWASTVELQLSVLIWTASHPDMQKIRIIGFFFDNRRHWQFAVQLLFTVCACD